MNPKSARRILLLTMLASLSTTALARDRLEGRRITGIALTYLLAGLIIDLAPVVGASLAILIATTIAIQEGEKAGRRVGTIARRGYQKTAAGAEPTIELGGIGGGSLGPLAPSGSWGGAQTVVQELTSGVRTRVGSAKRSKKYTIGGSVSDHSMDCDECYAEDHFGTQEAMDETAATIMRRLGREYRGGPLVILGVSHNGFRVQVLYRTLAGGNHFDHVHVGARRLGYDPSN